jgi:copper chaperone CopZ
MLQTLELQDLSCAGCAVTIRTGLEIAGFSDVKVNLLKKPHTVTTEVKDDEQLELMKKTLRDHGYYLIGDVVEPVPTNFNFA